MHPHLSMPQVPSHCPLEFLITTTGTSIYTPPPSLWCLPNPKHIRNCTSASSSRAPGTSTSEPAVSFGVTTKRTELRSTASYYCISTSMEPAQGLPFEVLEEITDGFSEERLLGTGAYGKVYKGIHKNGDEVAVKMVTDYDLDDWDFKELRNQMMLDHPNIVRVVAYCDETECKRIKYKGRYVIADLRHRALCLEYMHNGSLRKHLSDECDGLDWHTRYKIIKGTSEGLQYLHEGYTIPVYHMDLKPDNILLDRNMVPKLADFGLSPFGRDGSIRMSISSLITRVGTIGYLPPEYIRFGKITKKNDIFSLGVVMIKIIAGPRGRKRSAEMPPQEFIDQVQGNWRKRLQCTWSGSLLEAYCQQVKTCTEIALNCMEEDRHTRPGIAAIILSLNEMETMIEELKNDAESGLDEEKPSWRGQSSCAWLITNGAVV
ncbi:cysteine-rich receptor-like protein kinase 44 isoform X2 [Miscanthus floridulus]|uniref:cysteine-rich receptor-like protein kinase 44 isoform X2 n=1 Tax=Miscanthus floridulus TaxID=154761 RepID=UPI0034594F7F